MLRYIAIPVAFVLCAMPAIAEDDTRNDPRIAEALEQLPTEAEIDEMMSGLPDLTRLMGGMLEIATDEKNHAALERIAGRMEEKVGGLDLEADLEAGEVPDINGLMKEMMYLTADRELMTDVFSLAFQVQDVMEDVMPEADPALKSEQ